ncbi:Carboxylesterase [Fimicolochytrium jonesii]|uniref:Carboxylesterase n=1 Tax=Fimicolochytrium jonesii TaxID=1396493 RepID=UPI0022FE7537|nr:Carboxylesterase [Fimicolochytrium jonesii]KAI8822384.1 Carboxylesterase [Fimicolochytrium jonesii]
MHITSLLLAGYLGAQAVFAAATAPAAPYVKIGTTKFNGVATTTKSDAGLPVTQYLGIKFAAKPTRFSPATALALPTGDVDASKFGAICYQSFGGPGGAFTKANFATGTPAESEDCLNLNIWTPQGTGAAPKGNLPVLFWIYGGSFAFGGSGQPLHNSTVIAKHDVVVVTANYRTNVFGFPGASQLPLKEQNLGLLDQRIALQWVKKNILAFGGDPAKITIFGQSAGAVSVESLVLEGPVADRPFRAAITQSNVASQFLARPVGPLFNGLAAAVGCDATATAAQLTCMREKPADALIQAEQSLNLPFSIVVDEFTIFSDPVARRTSGLAAKVPMVIGTMQDEGFMFTLGTANFTQFVQATFPGAPVEVVTALYPIGAGKPYATDSDAAAAAFRDVVFQCKARIDSAIHAVKSNPRVHRYLYQASFANQQIIPGLPNGAYHSAELPLEFGFPIAGSTATELSLGGQIQQALATYAKNPAAIPGAPVITGKAGNQIAVVARDGTPSLQNQDDYDKTCQAIWDQYLLKGKKLTDYGVSIA